jgi:hypothetical protein
MITIFAGWSLAQGFHAAVIPAVGGLCAFLAAVSAKRLASGLTGTIFIVGAFVCILWLVGFLTGAFSETSSLYGRSETEIATVLRMFRDFRWFGSGLGTYPRVVQMYADVPSTGDGLFNAPPAGLSLLIELGMPLSILATALFVAIAWALFAKLARANREYAHDSLSCASLVYVGAAALTPGASLSFPAMTAAAMMIGVSLTVDQRPSSIPNLSASSSALRSRPSKRAHLISADL